METKRKKNRLFRTDWLGSKPIFYNEKNRKVSSNINKVIDFSNLEFHPEGLKNYLEFGYSVFGQTPVRNVKYLKHSSELRIVNNKLKIKELSDPIFDYLDKETKEGNVIEMLKQTVRVWEKGVKGKIIIPTSGGYDTRMLNTFVKDKSRIRSFTYGISENQCKSYEVVYAHELSKRLKTKWKQIALGDFHKYFDLWNDIFGSSTHAHGMYHIEFYSKIVTKVGKYLPLLSGIVGDIWAGNLEVGPIKNINDLVHLGYTHGISAEPSQCILKSGNDLKYDYFSKNKKNFKDKKWKIVEAMRFKMMLLSFLIRIPEYFHFKPWSPFLDIEVASAMLCLSEARRKNRLWQRDYFRKIGMNFEEMRIKTSKNNTLNFQAQDCVRLIPLNREVLKEIIKESYIEWINRNINNPSFLRKIQQFSYKLFENPVLYNLFHKFRISDEYNFANKEISAYSAYLTLKPLEELLIKRNST